MNHRVQELLLQDCPLTIKQMLEDKDQNNKVIMQEIEDNECNEMIRKTLNNFNITLFPNLLVENVQFSDKSLIESFYSENDNAHLEMFIKYSFYEFYVLLDDEKMISNNKYLVRCIKCDSCSKVFGYPFTKIYHSLTQKQFDLCSNCYSSEKENMEDEFFLNTVFKIHQTFYNPKQKLYIFWLKQ